ncbi:hypothetical protein ACQKPX_14120 [Photobacterium sp. DNB23_23_1]
MEKKAIILSLLQDKNIDIKLINNVMSNFNLNKKELSKVLSKFHVSRKNVIERAERYYKFEDMYTKEFLYISLLQFSILSPDDKEVYRIIHFTNRYGNSASGLISSLISVCSIKQLEIIIDNKKDIKQVHLFKIFKRALQLGDNNLYDIHKDLILEQEKQDKLELVRQYYSPTGISIDNIEIAFSKQTEKYFKDYLELFPSFNESFPEGKCLFDLRYNKMAQRILFRNLIAAVKKQIPFSFVRISDGEAYAFSDCPKLSKRQEVHWWGEELPLELRQEIKSAFNSILDSKFNLIGMPSPYKFLHYVDYNNNSSIDIPLDMEVKVVNRLAFTTKEIISRVESNSISAEYFTEDQINNVIFNKNSIQRLVRHSKRLIVISGYKSEAIKDKIPHDNIIVKEIPTHSMLKGKTETVKALRPLPFVYKEVNSWIEGNVQPGDLCLISAGFIGKIFISKAFAKGAVSLDVGQSLKVYF